MVTDRGRRRDLSKDLLCLLNRMEKQSRTPGYGSLSSSSALKKK